MPFELLIWLVPVAVTAAGLWRKEAGLVVLAASLPLFGSPPGGPYLAPLDVSALAAISTGLRGRVRRSALDLPVAALVLVTIGSFLPIAYHPPSWDLHVLAGLSRAFPATQSWALLATWRALANLLLGVGLYFAVRHAFARRNLRPLGLGLAAGLLLVLVLGLAEQIGLADLGGFRGKDWERQATRLQSLFFHAGWYAEYLTLAAPFAIASLLTGSRAARALGISAALMTLVSVPLTEQRGAWLTATIQLTALAVLLGISRLRTRETRRQALRLAAGATALFAMLWVVRPAIVGPVFERARNPTANLLGRARLAEAALGMLAERPVLGWGIGSFAPVYDDRHPPGTPGAVASRGTPHSLYLSVAAERGLAGLAAVALLIWVGGRSLRRVLRTEEPGRRALGRGLCLSFVGLLAYGLVQYNFHLKALEFLFWILLGSLALLAREDPIRVRLDRPRWPDGIAHLSDRFGLALCGLALLLMPWRTLALEPPGGESDRSFGFHEAEGKRTGPWSTWQWTEGRAALRLSWDSEILVIRLANGHPRPDRRPVEITVRFAGRELGRFRAPRQFESYRFDVGQPEGEWGVLELEARPTFRPFTDFRHYPELERSSDIRSLGVVVRRIWWGRSRRGAGSAPPAGAGPDRQRSGVGAEAPRR